MNKFSILLLLTGLCFCLMNCSSSENSPFEPRIVYESDHLTITQISENSYMHTSFLQTESFGKVPCNGMIVSDSKEVAVFDTPTEDTGSEELIHWVKSTLGSQIIAVVPTHFHEDCLGGLKSFHRQGIPSYSFSKTLEFAKEKGFEIPQNGFQDSVLLKVGLQPVVAKFMGEGHTKDNIVGYFSKDNILFGGCLIKELEASKGNLEDANVLDWSNTVRRIKQAYPKLALVIPGHGKTGDGRLLEYTINLFSEEGK